MAKRKNPHAVALGKKGGKSRGKRLDISELNRANAIAGHRKLGHRIAQKKCKAVRDSGDICKPLGSSNVDVIQALSTS
jgi:hypothetical protein